MNRVVRLSVAFLVGSGWITCGLGCSSSEETAGAVPTGLPATEVARPQDEPAGTSQAREKSRAQSVDASQLAEAVREEMTAAESIAKASTSDYLWMAPRKPVAAAPLTVTPPAGLQPLTLKIYVPGSNPLTKGKYELGRQLYFDARVSVDGTVSCATCHNPANGWTDAMPVSAGVNGQTGTRSSPTVLNAVYGKSMFWDGRAPSLEGQAQGPVQNPIEMGKQSYKEIVQRLRKIPGYRDQFEKVFGTDVTLDGLAKAIATFERVAALSGNSPFDKYNAGDNKALSDSEKRGLILFGLTLNTDDDFKTHAIRQKAKCTLCHVGFNFTDEQFHNLGIGWNEKSGRFKDLGRWAIDPIGAKNDASLGAFKTPTIRDIERTAPYMHDGSLATLEEVVDHYDKGGNPNPALDPDMKKLNLTPQEKKDVVAFMKALTGQTTKLEDLLPALPVGSDGKSPDPRAALTAPSKRVASVGFHPADLR
jgi:cytochrome c peroxidase